METARTKAPQLVWDRGSPIWRATRAAIKAGFPTKRVNLAFFANNEAVLLARCRRLTAEMNDWLSGRRGVDPVFDGTVRAVINLWQTDPSSPYHALEASSRHPYEVYARMIVATVGNRRLDALDGRDLRRWHAEWSAPLELGGKPRIAAARMAMIVLKTALTFAATCRKAGCADLRNILRDIDFPAPRPRMEAPTAAEIVAARNAARELGHAPAALAYALQFEGAMRQWDVVGKWVPLADKKPSSIIDGGKKWVGPMWSQIDEHLILRYRPSKTQFTSGAEVVLDLNALPMVLEELGRVPAETRRGPLIVNPRTGLPYRPWYYQDIWKRVRKMLASTRKFGTATPARGRLRKAGRPARRQTIWPRQPAIPTSGSQRGCTTATG
jgi:hypothetical protein